MNDVDSTVETYLAMWNETDPALRARYIEQAWEQSGRYIDPVLEADGHSALSTMVASVHERFPGQRFRRTSGIDAHHDTVRFAWELAAADGEVTVAGVDIGVLGPDRRLRSMTGFFDELPEPDAA